MNYKQWIVASIALVLVGAGIAKNSIQFEIPSLQLDADTPDETDKTEEVAHIEKVELTAEERFALKANALFQTLDLNEFNAPSEKVFTMALKGYYKMEEEGILKNNKLTIVDFSVSSTQKRLWVIDMEENAVVLESVVAHGKRTGDEFATAFSNRINSHMSSLGFYKTGETYQGINGFSLRLDGLEKGINDNARTRAIVVHGADYASPSLALKQGRLGRSYGCPAVPNEVNKELIELIKDESCLFIYSSQQDYLKRSKFLI
ncbi:MULTISPECIES: murein L,D-transpeptidase catalytic domain family protein [unclassified Myroides]|uniref:murein L,D-transpeptidase catalytic domain family protein n=1 Tax=unclassified Myroides TaxID=2642485 RepID=UPI0015FBC5DF|nr:MULTISPECIES: murein L,D-transpeptidase catalytic domain family protein [unclassified Myroides]MBB1148652.1 murein L,D-transpeptidase catalytic domain family protein [Myroides sp. NP-2]MDM1406363.1 murein L,D-transpeptidase catalytic domain family protein [Myroides sp. DF42-4-2]